MSEDYGKVEPRRFLLVEDDDDHAKIIERSFRDSHHQIILDRVKDGVEALTYLRRSPNLVPDAVLLDLKLPKKDGHEVLQEIKEDPLLRSTPVIILTTSDAEIDRIKAYEHYANSYLVKPLDRNAFTKMIQDLSLYWGLWNKSLEAAKKEPATARSRTEVNL
jgi:hypothetical protein